MSTRWEDLTEGVRTKRALNLKLAGCVTALRSLDGKGGLLGRDPESYVFFAVNLWSYNLGCDFVDGKIKPDEDESENEDKDETSLKPRLPIVHS